MNFAFFCRMLVRALLTTQTERIRDRMAALPDQYRRVEVLPVWFIGSAVTDASLASTDLKALNRQVGTNLLTEMAIIWVGGSLFWRPSSSLPHPPQKSSTASSCWT